MQRIDASGPRRRSAKGRSRVKSAVAHAGIALFSWAGIQVAGPGVAGAVTQGRIDTGFTKPFSGARRYEHLAPMEITKPGQLNRRIGSRVAVKIARRLGLNRADTFKRKQYVEFVTGKGVCGNLADAKLVDQSVRIFTNTRGRPLRSNVNGDITRSVLASYGLFVNRSGLLESLANTDAPTRKANSVIAPGGYLGMWCKANGAKASLRMLYKSAYTLEAVYGNKSGSPVELGVTHR